MLPTVPALLRPGARISARETNADRTALRGMRGEGGIRVEARRSGFVISGVSGRMKLSRFAFGWAGAGSAANKVRITAGYVSGFNSFISCGVDGAGEVTVAGNASAPHFIIAQGQLEPFNGVIVSTSVLAASFSGHTSNMWRVPLYRVYLRNGRATYDLILHVGVIDLKTWYGP